MLSISSPLYLSSATSASSAVKFCIPFDMTKLARRGNQDDAILHTHVVAWHVLTRRTTQHPPVAHVEPRQMDWAGQHAAVQLAIGKRAADVRAVVVHRVDRPV